MTEVCVICPVCGKPWRQRREGDVTSYTPSCCCREIVSPEEYKRMALERMRKIELMYAQKG